MTRIDAIVQRIREELEHRPQALEGGGLRALNLQLYFDGEAWQPRTVVVRTEFETPRKRA